MVAPDAPFPKTAASSPGDFKEAYEAAFAAGAEAIVSVHVAGTLSGTIKSAQIARDMLPDREIHVVDSHGASMAQGILARMGVELAAEGRPAAEIAETPRGARRRHPHLRRPRHPRIPQEGRPHQRGLGGHRHPALGQADHQGQGRRGRDGRQGAHAQQGARAADRAHRRATDRAAGDPAHDQPRRRGVPRPGPRPGARARSGRRDDRPRRAHRSGRISAPAASARRSCIAPDTARNLATRLRQCCRPGTIGEARIAGSRLYSAPNSSRVPTVDPDLPATGRRAPWGRPGDGPDRGGR